MSQLTLPEIIVVASTAADIAADSAKAEHPGSNGSEAWQAVSINTKGNRSLAAQLRKAGVRKDAYWGYIISARGLSNYFAEEAWTNTFVAKLREFDVPARRVERLL